MTLYLLIKDNVIIDSLDCLNINQAREQFKLKYDTYKCVIGKVENYYKVD